MDGALRRGALAGLVLASCAVAGESRPALGQASPGPLDADDAICRAWVHGWASGAEDDGGLLTYGTPFAQRFARASTATPDPATGGSLVRRRQAEILAVGPALVDARGPVLAGASRPTDDPDVYAYPGPRVGNGPGAGARLRGGLVVGSAFAAVDAVVGLDAPEVRVVGAGGSWGAVDGWGGLLAARTGPACDGGLVLGGRRPVRIYGGELLSAQPWTLPLVGRTWIGLQVGVLDEAGPGNRRPLFHSMRIELQPHPDWAVGLNRAVLFGGSSTSVGVTPRALLLMALGITDAEGKDSDFENQVASVDVRWRTRVAGRPTLFTAEYAADDAGPAVLKVPALQASGEVRAGPEGAPWAGVAATWMPGGRPPHPPWYRHGALAWGWTDRGALLGDALGGEGWAVLATLRAESPLGGWSVAAGPVRRGPDNLLAPALEGPGFRGIGSGSWTVGAWEFAAGLAVDAAGEVGVRGSLSLLRRIAPWTR